LRRALELPHVRVRRDRADRPGSATPGRAAALASARVVAARPRAVDGRPDPATALVRADETARLVRALGRLSERQRQVLHLVFYEDLTIAEAPAVAGVSVGTARTHYERGKAALRTLLGEERERSSATITTGR